MDNIQLQKKLKTFFIGYLKSQGLKMKDANFTDLQAYTMIGKVLEKPQSNATAIGDVERDEDERGGEYRYIQKACAE